MTTKIYGGKDISNFPGKLIVFDGPDGTGKGTQANLVIERLKKEGYQVDTLDFPNYESVSSYFVKNYLNGKYGNASEVNPKLSSLFYALDRFDTKASMIDSLKKGHIIISNRYVSASAGHQGGKINDTFKRKAFIDWLYDLEFSITGLPRPDLNIYLNIPWEIGQLLVDKKGKRDYIGEKKRDIHEDDSNHLKNAQDSYLYLLKTEPNWIKVDCISDGDLLSIETIHELVWNEIKKNILNDFDKSKLNF